MLNDMVHIALLIQRGFMDKLLFSFIPVIGGLIAAWISSVVVWKQKETSIIDRISQELNNTTQSSFVLEVSISRLFRCRTIPFNILSHILKMNNSVDIISLSAPSRRLLEVLSFSEVGGIVQINYSPPFISRRNRFITVILCFAMMIICTGTASDKLAHILLIVSGVKIIAVNEFVEVFFYIFYLGVTMLGTFVFARQFFVLINSGNRLKKIRHLLEENYHNVDCQIIQVNQYVIFDSKSLKSKTHLGL